MRFLTDDAGAVTDTYTYDAFGTLISRTGTTPNEYLYAGERFDPETGMYHLRARYMRPETGRFWSMDSYEGRNFDPASLHKYLYANANPVGNVDPSGQMTIGEIVTVAAVVGTLAAIGGLLYLKFRKTTSFVSFEWRGKMSYGQDALSTSEAEEIQTLAIQEMKRAYTGFSLVIVNGGATNKIIVSAGELGDAVGKTYLGDAYSTVYYDDILIHARRYARERGITDRSEILRGVGKAIGAVAAHEFGHQKGFVLDNGKDPNTYDYHTGDRWQLYYGDLRWSSQAMEEMNRRLSRE